MYSKRCLNVFDSSKHCQAIEWGQNVNLKYFRGTYEVIVVCNSKGGKTLAVKTGTFAIISTT